MGRDPDYLAHMRKVAEASAAPSSRSITELRRRHTAALQEVPRAPVGEIRDLAIDGPAGPLPARLYHPARIPAEASPSATGPAAGGAGTGAGARAGERRGDAPPALVFAHGGGWVMGDVDGYDPVARALANACGTAIVSVGYRRPPEDPFPAPLNDMVAAIRWVRGAAGRLGVDPVRIGVAGDSAGGNLAAAATLLLRDAGDPPLCLQLLVYPALDLREIPPLPPDPDGLVFSDPDGRGVARVRDLYLAGLDPADPLASPLLAPDPAGLPQTVVATAEYDRLRAQGEAYERRLRAAGVETALIDGAGLDHGFLGYGAFARRPAETIEQIGRRVRAILATT